MKVCIHVQYTVRVALKKCLKHEDISMHLICLLKVYMYMYLYIKNNIHLQQTIQVISH